MRSQVRFLDEASAFCCSSDILGSLASAGRRLEPTRVQGRRRTLKGRWRFWFWPSGNFGTCVACADLPVETLNLHGPPSLSIPFPPFLSSSPPPPPPPPVVPPTLLNKAELYVRAHPYLCASGAFVAVGLGVHATIGYKLPYLNAFYARDGQVVGRRRVRGQGLQGAVEDGMLREAIGE